MIKPASPVRLALSFSALLVLGGCDSLSNTFTNDKVDYKSGNAQAQKDTLEIPPDINALPRDDHYRMTNASGGSATASQTKQDQARPANPVASGPEVLKSVSDAHMERAGGQRWLVVNRTPEQLWPVIRQFWQENGFQLVVDSPDTGIIETDYAENHAKLPLDIIRRSVGKLLDTVYDTGERDKYRTRLERRPEGGTEIYISHHGMVEVITNQQTKETTWTQRPSDPELEAEFLRRLLVRLGSDEPAARAVVAGAPDASGQPTVVAADGVRHARLISNAGAASYLQLDDSFDRAWRRVGLALDRVNFTVEDRDRGRGMYFVRYVDMNADQQAKGDLLARVFNSDKGKIPLQYRILVQAQKDGSGVHVSVLNKDGAAETGDVATRILSLLGDQLN